MLACSPECRSKENEDLTAHPHWWDERYLFSSAVVGRPNRRAHNLTALTKVVKTATR